jgi:lysyl oxidase-like protein 2/3/4
MDALQKRQGNFFFANADWANAWRNFIDGALEQGALNANRVIAELRREDKEAQPSRPSL